VCSRGTSPAGHRRKKMKIFLPKGKRPQGQNEKIRGGVLRYPFLFGSGIFFRGAGVGSERRKLATGYYPGLLLMPSLQQRKEKLLSTGGTGWHLWGNHARGEDDLVTQHSLGARKDSFILSLYAGRET